MTEDIEYLQDAHSALKRLHYRANETNDKLVEKINNLNLENQRMHATVENAEKNLLIQKNIVVNTILDSQKKHENDYVEINSLKEKIKLLEEKIKLIEE